MTVCSIPDDYNAEQARKILTKLGDANQYLAERLNELTILYNERIR